MVMGPRLAVAGLVCLAFVALSGCGGSSEGEGGDGPVYESVEALATKAELVVLGAVGPVRGTEVDDGGNEDGRGPDVTFHSMVVHEVLASGGAATAVASGDLLAVGVTEGSTELFEGDEMVLFLEVLTPAEAPGIDLEDVFYVIVGQENGAFGVQDGAVIARSEHVHGLADAGEDVGAPFTTSLGDLRSFLSER